jgi:hypothetical protein
LQGRPGTATKNPVRSRRPRPDRSGQTSGGDASALCHHVSRSRRTRVLRSTNAGLSLFAALSQEPILMCAQVALYELPGYDGTQDPRIPRFSSSDLPRCFCRCTWGLRKGTLPIGSPQGEPIGSPQGDRVSARGGLRKGSPQGDLRKGTLPIGGDLRKGTLPIDAAIYDLWGLRKGTLPIESPQGDIAN